MDLGEMEEEKRKVREAEERAAEEARKAAAEAKARADAESARIAAEAAAAAMAAKRAAEAQAAETARKSREQMRREAQAISQLTSMCPSEFNWVREATGFRCSAGGHFVPYWYKMGVAKTQYKINSFNRSSRCECILTCGMRLHTQHSSLLVRHQDMPTSGLTHLKFSRFPNKFEPNSLCNLYDIQQILDILE